MWKLKGMPWSKGKGVRKPAGKTGAEWKETAGTLLGGAASFLVLWAVRSAREHRSRREALARSGQAPSRTHIRLASHPAFREY